MTTIGNRILATNKGFEGFEWSHTRHGLSEGMLVLNFNSDEGRASFYIGEFDAPIEFLNKLIEELHSARDAYTSDPNE
jgi:hypothetical protein